MFGKQPRWRLSRRDNLACSGQTTWARRSISSKHCAAEHGPYSSQRGNDYHTIAAKLGGRL